MRSLFTPILLLVSITSQAQLPPALQWQKCIGGSERDEIHSMVLTTDGGLIMIGLSYSSDGDVGNNKGGSDVLIPPMGVIYSLLLPIQPMEMWRVYDLV